MKILHTSRYILTHANLQNIFVPITMSPFFEIEGDIKTYYDDSPQGSRRQVVLTRRSRLYQGDVVDLFQFEGILRPQVAAVHVVDDNNLKIVRFPTEDLRLEEESLDMQNFEAPVRRVFPIERRVSRESVILTNRKITEIHAVIYEEKEEK